MASRISATAPSKSLRCFYEQVVHPSFVRMGKSSSHLERHSAAVSHFEQFYGGDIPPGDIDEDLLIRFDAYLWKEIQSDQRHRNLSESIRRIVGKFDPEQWIDRRVRRPLPDPLAGTLRHFFEKIYVPHRLIGRAESTIQEYRSAFYKLQEHYKRDITLAEMNDDVAAEHFKWLLDSGIQATTINTGSRAAWFAVWRYAFEMGHVDRPPKIRKLPQFTTEPDAWSRDEVERIVSCCWIVEGQKIERIPAEQWWDAVFRTLWYTALRLGTLRGLCRADVDLDNGKLSVPPELMKNRHSKKFQLGSDAISAIKEIWLPERALLFPTRRWDKAKLYRQFNEILVAAKIPPSDSHLGHFHKFRRSVATEVAKKSGTQAASELLGHRSQFVISRYIDKSQMPGQDFTDVLKPLARNVRKIPR